MWLAWLTVAAFFGLHLGERWLTELVYPVPFGLLFLWLFIMVIWNSFEIAHHVELLSEAIREPFGTLVLTLSVTSIEIVTIVNIMLIGEENPTLVRDTMYSILMIVLNGIVGLSLLLGGIRYREQRYNLRGSIEFISVILVLAVIDLILPDFTHSTSDRTFSTGQCTFFNYYFADEFIRFFRACKPLVTALISFHHLDKNRQKPMKIHIKYSEKMRNVPCLFIDCLFSARLGLSPNKLLCPSMLRNFLTYILHQLWAGC